MTDEESPTTLNNATIEALKERLAFFFSSANIRRDKFMQETLRQNSNTVPLDVLLKFNTIKKISTNKNDLVEAAKLVEEPKLKVSQSGEAIGRIDAGWERVEGYGRILHVSDLPVEGKRYNVTIEEIKSVFEGLVENTKVVLVDLKFQRGGKPVGWCNVEFEKDEQTEAVLKKVQDTESFLIGDQPVKIQKFEEYLKSRPEPRSHQNKRKVRDIVSKDDVDDTAATTFDFKWEKGCVIKLEGLAEDGCDREAIRSALKDYDFDSKAVFVDYSRGQTEGAVRFETPNDKMEEICKKLNDGELQVNEKPIQKATILEGDVEEDYWKKWIEFKTLQLKSNAARKKGRKH